MRRVDTDKEFIQILEKYSAFDGMEDMLDYMKRLTEELRLRRGIPAYTNKVCNVCCNTSANHAHDDNCPVKQLEEME